jgi:hypothetical protein
MPYSHPKKILYIIIRQKNSYSLFLAENISKKNKKPNRMIGGSIWAL